MSLMEILCLSEESVPREGINCFYYFIMTFYHGIQEDLRFYKLKFFFAF